MFVIRKKWRATSMLEMQGSKTTVWTLYSFFWKVQKEILCECFHRLFDVVQVALLLCFAESTKINSVLRGAWRNHCFPAPFSRFLHETGLERLKITSACCFSLKCQRKDSKKVKEHRHFSGVLGRWCTAAIDRTTFHACQWCRKTAVFAVSSRSHLARKSLSWPAMPVSNKEQAFEQGKRIKLFNDFWVRAYWFDFAPRCRPRARSM